MHLLFLAFALLAPAADAPRVTVLVDGGVGVGAKSYASTRTLRQFAEDGRLESRYDADGAPSWGGALQVRVGRRLGVVFGGSVIRRDQAGTWSAELPHPLYVDRDRLATGTLGGSLKETDVFTALAWIGGGERVDLRLFAGPCFFPSVTADVVRDVSYTHAYPYDEVTVTGTGVSEHDGSGVGVTAGAGVDYRFGRRVGLGLQGRYSRATVSLRGDDVEPAFELDAGGLTVSAGLRVRF